MPTATFLDTNILIYAATGKQSEPGKWAISHDLLAEPDATISAQVLAEFYSNVVRKRYLSLRDAGIWLDRLSLMPMVNVDAALVIEGAAISQRYQISHWDGAIVAACNRCEASVLYTEDLNGDQLYGAVRAINPFSGLVRAGEAP